jgi:hypothetical protein
LPRDIKPLSRTRRTEVLRIARRHPELESLLQARARALFVEPNIADRGQPEGAEQAVVGLYDYASNRSLVALVDPERGEVVSVEETPAQFQLSDEERAEAEQLAGADERVREFLAGRGMNALTRLYFPPQAREHEPAHRHAIVFLRPNNQERRYAVVDLSERSVVDVLTPEALTAD